MFVVCGCHVYRGLPYWHTYFTTHLIYGIYGLNNIYAIRYIVYMAFLQRWNKISSVLHSMKYVPDYKIK